MGNLGPRLRAHWGEIAQFRTNENRSKVEPKILTPPGYQARRGGTLQAHFGGNADFCVKRTDSCKSKVCIKLSHVRHTLGRVQTMWYPTFITIASLSSLQHIIQFEYYNGALLCIWHHPYTLPCTFPQFTVHLEPPASSPWGITHHHRSVARLLLIMPAYSMAYSWLVLHDY